MELLCILLTIILFAFKLLSLVNISWLMVFDPLAILLIYWFIIAIKKAIIQRKF